MTGGLAKETAKEKKQKKKKKNADDPPTVKKPDTKHLADTTDTSLGAVSDEDGDDRSGGGKLLPLLLEISKPFRTADGKKKVRCLASAGCHATWSWPRSKDRILKHAMSCSYLAALDGGALVTQAITELAKRNPELLESLNTKFGLESKRPREA